MNRTATLILAAALLLVAASPAPGGGTRLRTGDLVFQSMGSEQGEAIERATRSQYSHVGMIFADGRRVRVLEAVGPVKYTPWREWAARGTGGRYAVRRLRDADRVLSPAAAAALRREAEKFLGRPYDFLFGWSDDRIYCSEFVWKAYRNALGIELAAPARLRDFDLSDPLVARKLRERYGDGIPLDEPVVSPQQLFASDRLAPVETR